MLARCDWKFKRNKYYLLKMLAFLRERGKWLNGTGFEWYRGV